MTEKAAMEFQVLQQQLQGLRQREQMLFERYEDVIRTKSCLEELENANGDALVAVGAGNFVSGSIKDTKSVVVGVGSGVAIKKKREDAIRIMEDRMREMEKAFEEIKEEGHEIMGRLQEIQSQLGKK